MIREVDEIWKTVLSVAQNIKLECRSSEFMFVVNKHPFALEKSKLCCRSFIPRGRDLLGRQSCGRTFI